MFATSATEFPLEGACSPEMIPMDASDQWRTPMQINSSTTEGTSTYSLHQSINLSINLRKEFQILDSGSVFIFKIPRDIHHDQVRRLLDQGREALLAPVPGQDQS